MDSIDPFCLCQSRFSCEKISDFNMRNILKDFNSNDKFNISENNEENFEIKKRILLMKPRINEVKQGVLHVPYVSGACL
jgi:hypothetical protein